MIPPQSWAGSVGAGIGPGASWPLALAAALSSGPPGGGDPHAHMGAAARGGHFKASLQQSGPAELLGDQGSEYHPPCWSSPPSSMGSS